MSAAVVYLAIVLLMSSISGREGYRTGAPVGRCDSMMPNHGGAQSQTVNSTVPYSITSSMPVYMPGTKMMVTVSARGSTNFKGLILQARDSNSNRMGTFSLMPQESNLQLLACGGTADTGVTHTNNETKTSITVYWTAPMTDAGAITFTATVVKQFDIFYAMVNSIPIGYVPGNAGDNNKEAGNAAGSVAGDMAVIIASTFLCLSHLSVRFISMLHI